MYECMYETSEVTRSVVTASGEVDTRPASKGPLICAYGMGVDSTAYLVEFIRRGIKPDLILFADTGSEKDETYNYLPVIQEHLAKHGFPPVITVRYAPKHGLYTSLEGNCLVNKTLPSLAFGYKKCSLKWKRQPQDAYVRKFFKPAKDAWKAGEKCVKVIGYDAGPKDRRRGNHIGEEDKYAYWYPLQDWGWDRERCVKEIAREGLPVPMKSACWFCPASKPDEIRWLIENHPDIADRIIQMESNAAPNLVKIEGLWRTSTKGKRGGEARPGSMSKFIEQHRSASTSIDR